jgi:hypothetical protein
VRPDPCVFDIPVEYRIEQWVHEHDRWRGVSGSVPFFIRDNPLDRAQHERPIVCRVINEDFRIVFINRGVERA